MNQCQCGRPVSEAFLCGTCTAQLRATLESVADLATELDTTITRQAAIGERGGPRAADKPLPFHVAASEAAWVLRNTLTTWLRVILDERHENTTTGSAAFLAAHLEQLRHHEAAGEAMDEIRGACEQATRAIDRPINDRTYIGPCTCGTELYAKPGATNTTCRDCDTTHDVEARREAMRQQLHDHLGTASYVATVATGLGVKVTPTTVRMWAQRKYLEPVDTARGTRLFRVGDVIDVAQATTAQRKTAKI